MKKSYIDWTYNSKNPIRRFAHRTRFRKSLEHVDLQETETLLDFGCGDGLFLNQVLAQHPDRERQLYGFEPYLQLLENNSVSIFREWEKIVNLSSQEGKFNIITAFEVFEHFSSERQKEALERIRSVLAPNGTLIISVPIEKGFPGLLKTAIRRVNHPHNKHLYNWGNALKSLIGRPLPQYRNGDSYLSHLGFYFSDLENLFQKNWEIESRSFSPFSYLNHNLNSQVFYNLKKR